jgi:hypothetical protein
VAQRRAIDRFGQEPQEGFEVRRIEFLGRRELPEDRSEFGAELGDTLLDVAADGLPRPGQIAPIGDEP